MTREQKEALTEALIIFAAVMFMLAVVLGVGCKTPTATTGGVSSGLATVNQQSVDGTAKALEAATADTAKATASNREAIEAYREVCVGGPVKVQDRVALALTETDTLLGRVGSELVEVKAKGALAVAGWSALEQEYREKLAAAEKKEQADADIIAKQKIELTARAKWTWFLLVAGCVAVVIGGAALFGITKDKLWLAVSGAGVAGGVAVEVFKKIDALPDWFWMSLVGTLVLGGGGAALWQFVLSHKTPAAGKDVPTVGAKIAALFKPKPV